MAFHTRIAVQTLLRATSLDRPQSGLNNGPHTRRRGVTHATPQQEEGRLSDVQTSR